jgi:hypothetical protein
VCKVDPYAKTFYFERHTDWGTERLHGVPEGCKPPTGYVEEKVA